ncbi:MAG: AI-2E family transporter [Deltaproteobacteria bacterium]|nr:MAG: AI-2E family transporter [Deltaproteobacteria bacterium]
MRSSGSPDMILWFFLGLFLISIYLVSKLLWPFVSTIVMAMVIMGLFRPVYALLNRKMGKQLASFCVCCLIFILIFIPIAFLVGILAREAYGFYLAAKGAILEKEVIRFLEASHLLGKINAFLRSVDITLTLEDLLAPVTDLGRFAGLFLFEQVSAVASNVFSFLANSFFMLLIVFFLFMDGGELQQFFMDLSPLPADQDEKLLRKFEDMLGAVLIGNGAAGLIQGVLGGILFSVLGVNSPFLWGVIMGFLAFLPIVGIGVVLVPTVVIFLVKGRVVTCIGILIFYVVVSGGIDYIFKPKLVGDRVKIHTLLVFLSIIGGLRLFGILGIIYGPLVVTFFLTLTDIYLANYQRVVENKDASNMAEKLAPEGADGRQL